MRRDIFLHFLNRDTREIFGIYDNFGVVEHASLMRRALNAAAILCEDHCIAPPGFIVEDQIAFDIAENQQAYLKDALIKLPMRENNLADFAEKKRIGYEPMRNRYSGLFDDTRIGFLGRHATGIINRKSHITEGILSSWEEGPDSKKRVWLPTKKLLHPSLVDQVAKIPKTLDDRGTAVTWAAIEPELPDEARTAASHLRNTLQNVYFGQYCSEFRLIAVSGIPFISHDFSIPTESGYNYRWLVAFLEIFDLREMLLDAPAPFILELRKHLGFIAFIDAFVGLAKQASSATDLKFFAGQARKAVRFTWDSLKSRQLSLYSLSRLEITELASALQEVAAYLTVTHGLADRGSARATASDATKGIALMSADPELVFFVALEEELDVVTRSLGLKKVPGTPEAIGDLNGVSVGVICPRNMGRVAAAVAMAGYLAGRKQKPKLILIVGLAGGFPENRVEQGYLIVVTKVIDLALRKVVDETDGPSPHFRREDYSLNDQLMRQIFSDDLEKDDWSARVCKELKWPPGRRPSLHSGAMASADEVVASDGWRKQILEGRGGDPKLLGVEMEAGGVCEAARRANVPVSMLRVVSDQADPSKADDSWRALGMNTLCDLIKSIPMDKVLSSIR